MNFFKKTIFLTNDEKSKDMAILTLEERNGTMFGRIKTYSKIFGDYVLGLKFDKKILKQNIKLDSTPYEFILSEKINLQEPLGCVVLSIKKDDIIPVLWGSEKSEHYRSQIINTLRDNVSRLSQSISRQSTQIDCDKTSNVGVSIPNDTTPPIEKNTTEEPETEIDISCEEKYSQISLEEEILEEGKSDVAVACSITEELFGSTQEDIENDIDNELSKFPSGKHKFYDMISDQLEELFLRYPKEENLSKLIENSSWVKIDTDIDNKYHIVGIISHQNDIRYICYGVPGRYGQEPPIEMRNYSQWLPVDTLDPYNNGYWVMYQDADTGENVLMN